jgi:hypothetical protein
MTHTLLIPANLAGLAKLVAKENGRWEGLTGLLLSATEDGYQVEATAGRRRALVRGDGKSDEGVNGATNGATEALVPCDRWSGLLRLAKKGPAAVVLSDSQTVWKVGDQIAHVANVEGRWPPVDQCLPKDEPAAEFSIDPRLFAELLLVASACLGDEDNVRIRFWHKDKPVAVTGRCETLTFFGMQMPLMEPEGDDGE